MSNTTVSLPDDLRGYARAAGVNLSGLLQQAVRAHRAEHDSLEAKFREELEKYRSDPERQAEFARLGAGNGLAQFRPCPACGTAVDEAEGCMAMFEPYDAAPVALLAHYPDDMRRANLRYWADSGCADVTLGMPE